jgi:hypothetical protein
MTVWSYRGFECDHCRETWNRMDEFIEHDCHRGISSDSTTLLEP